MLAHHAADVVLLQEVDDGAPRSRELDLRASSSRSELDYPLYAVGHNVTLRKGRYGNATLSRFPILRERNIDLTIGSRKRRGCQHTTIRLARGGAREQEIEVFNLHLGLSARERAQQIGLLVRSREFATLDPSRACLVGGDFNDWRCGSHPIFTEILDFRCATRRDTPHNGTFRTYPSFSPTTAARPDLLPRPAAPWSRRGPAGSRVARVASDHLPVLADFELHDPRGAAR